MKLIKYLFLIIDLFLAGNSYAAAADIKQVQEANKNQTQFALNLGDKIALDGDGLTLKVYFKDQGDEHFRVVKIKPGELLKVHSEQNSYLIGFSVSFSINKIKFATNVLNFKFMNGRKFIIKIPFVDREGEIKIDNIHNNHGINKLIIPAIGLMIKDI